MDFKWPPDYAKQAQEQAKFILWSKEGEERNKEKKLKELEEKLESIRELKELVMLGTKENENPRGRTKYLVILDDFDSEISREKWNLERGPMLMN